MVMHDVSTAAEHMIAALGTGVTDAGLEMIGRAAGASIAEVAELVLAIRPALLPEEHAPAHRVLVVGGGATSQHIVQVLASAGFDVWVAGDAAAEGQQCEFAIIVAQFVIDPALHGVWLRRDIPHLGVVLGDTEARIGPVVDPGRSACLYCLQFHASDADSAWSAMASQLWGRRSPADTELVASEVAGRTARLVIDWFASLTAGSQERLDVASGRVSTAHYEPHPTCGCLSPGVANAISPARRGIGSATAGPAGPVPTNPPAPTRG